MNSIDRAGLFRGKILDKAVGLTSKSKLPQLVIRFQAVEYYDETEGEWVSGWEDYQQAITGYYCLFAKDGKPTLSCEQVQKVFDWNGKSFKDLDDCEGPELVQFKVKEEEYEGESRLVVSWLDEYDADPRTGITKLNEKELKELDNKFASALQQIRKPNKPKSVKENLTEKASTPPSIKGDNKKEDDKPKQSKSNKTTAWGKLVEANLAGANLDDKALSELWQTVITDTVGDIKEEEDITPEQWGEIESQLIEAVSKL